MIKESSTLTTKGLSTMLSRFKQRINFYFEDLTTPMGKAFDLVVISLIFLVCVAFVVETYDIPERVRKTVNLLETTIIVIFIIEYLLRFWVAEKKLKHLFHIYSLIDLAAILPIFFAYIMVAIVFVSAGLIFYAEHEINPEKFRTFFDAIYFSVVTLTTVGFGDITPVSDYGRTITVLIIISGIIFIPWQVRNLIAHFIVSTNKISLVCKECGLEYHERDALHCKYCGSRIFQKKETS